MVHRIKFSALGPKLGSGCPSLAWAAQSKGQICATCHHSNRHPNRSLDQNYLLPHVITSFEAHRYQWIRQSNPPPNNTERSRFLIAFDLLRAKDFPISIGLGSNCNRAPTMAAAAVAELSLIKPITKLNIPSSNSTPSRPNFQVIRAASASTPTKPKPRKAAKTEIKESLLTPRFYTTDFDEMETLFNKEINENLNQAEFEALLNEFKTDYNQTHFVRNTEFKEAADKMQGPLRQIFVEFLERSCTAEFSGFLLYKELGRRLKV